MGLRGSAFTKPSIYHPAYVVHGTYIFHNHCFKIIHGHIHVLYSGSVVTTFCDEEDMLKAIYFQTSEM